MARKQAAASKVNQEADYLFRMICQHLVEIHGQINENRLRQAYELALSAHEGQTRIDGTPYIIHPLEVAEICVQLNMGEDSIITALLHDTVEDTAVRLNQIRQLFGPTVAKMVDNLTKIKKIDLFGRFTGRNKASIQARNLQRLFISMTRDTRVILIKLADRLHNMKTMGPMPAHKRQRISRETLEFYIPIARRLGLGQIVGEFEDLVFEVLHPDEFKQLNSDVSAIYEMHEQNATEMIKQVTGWLEEAGLAIHRIYGRRKHLYSIHQKMHKQLVGLDGVYDLLAIRIILEGTELDCYKALGLIHMHYKPIFHRFRDFIASPKENGYQTLHTTVVGVGGSRVECQIRTRSMDQEATKGVASHWSYKETGLEIQRSMKDSAWQEFIMELTDEKVDSEEFVAKARDTLLGDQVLVLSPRGEVVNLPVGSTPVDFAYYIHTDLGHTARSAKVNGTFVPLNYELHNGDVVEIIKADEPDAAPRPEWLIMAKSPKSLLKIRRYYKSRPRSERVAVGRGLLRQHIVREGLYPLNLTANDKLVELLKQLSVRSIDDLYDKVALGTFHCDLIVSKLKDIHRTKVEKKAAKPKPARMQEPQDSRVGLIDLAGSLGVCLADGRPMRRKAELMNCCTPIPGDKIYGIWDRDVRRVRTHRADCDLLEEAVSVGEAIQLSWLPDKSGMHYPVRVQITSLNRVGLLFEVMRFLSSLNINLGGADFTISPTVTKPDQNAQFVLVLEVEDRGELERCVNGIMQIDDVIQVDRVLRIPASRDDQGSV